MVFRHLVNSKDNSFMTTSVQEYRSNLVHLMWGILRQADNEKDIKS